MTSQDFEICEYVYSDAVCPVCGFKASYEPDPAGGLHAYKEIICGHSELKKIIEQRENEYLARFQQEPRTVRLQLSPRYEDLQNDNTEIR